MYDPILVPTDGSEHAARAAEHGFFLAEAFDATVHLVNVVDVRAAAGPFDLGGVGDEFVEELEAAAESTIDSLAAAAPSGVPVERAIVDGDPEDAILEYVDDHDVALVAMGTHGRAGIERYMIGSVSESLVRHAPVPVLTARATDASSPADAYDEILVPTDGSDAAVAAIDHAVAIAAAVDARVHAVNVIDLGDVAASAEYSLPSDLIATLEERGESATDVVAERARDAGLEPVTAVIRGYPARDLLTYAEDNGIDLIAMGTAGRTGIERFLLGSTTERLVRHSDVPVLSVNGRVPTAE